MLCTFSRADAWRDQPTRVRQNAMLLQLCRWFGPNAAHASEIVECDWSSHPTVKGCPVSVFAPPSKSALEGDQSEIFTGEEVRQSHNGNVFFASTETAVRGQGFMDGAVRAGLRAARSALDYLALQTGSRRSIKAVLPDHLATIADEEVRQSSWPVGLVTLWFLGAFVAAVVALW